jgi:lipopolysaccharide transport system permease protein
VGNFGGVSSAGDERWVENTPSQGWRSALRLGDLWSQRELALLFAWRDLKLRYKQTLLGVAWAILQPLLAMALFSVLIERAVHIPSQGVPYALFAYVGLSAWTALTTGVSRAAESLTEDPKLVRNVFFPRVLAPIGALGPIGLDLGLALIVAVPLMAIYGVAPGPELALLPVCVLGLYFVAFSVGVWLSALHVLYRDVRYAMTFALQAWLFATPVLFPSSLVRGHLRYLLFVNPAAGAIEALRGSILGTPVSVIGLAISAVAAATLAASGTIYFGRVERRFADQI